MDHRQRPIFILPDLSFDDGFHDERHAILRQGAKDGKGPSRQGVFHTIGRTFAAQRLVSSQPFHPTHDKLMMRSEENTPELQSLIRISYAVICLKKKITQRT